MRRLLCAIVLSGLSCFQSALPAETTKVFLTTGEWEPYTSEKQEGFGVFTEIVSAVFKEAGLDPDYKFYPWKRAEQITDEGKAFAVFPYIFTEERNKNFDFSDIIMPSSFVLFYLTNSYPHGIKFSKMEALSPYRISGVLGYWYEKPFKDAGLNVEYVASDEQSIMKLYLKRVDLAAAGELVGWALIKRLYPQEVSRFAVVDTPLKQDNLRLMISRKYPNAAELTKRFNAGLKSIREKGLYSQILSKHGMKE